MGRELIARGDDVSVVTHERNEPVFKGSGLEYCTVGDHFGKLLQPLLQEVASEKRATSIILCDLLTADGMLSRFGIPGEILFDLGPQVIAVDTWENGAENRAIDVFMNKRLALRPWTAKVPQRLGPSPLLRPECVAGRCRFMPPPYTTSRKIREHIRRNLGMTGRDRLVMFCTAHWQQATYEDEHGARIAEYFAMLLARYLESLAPQIHLVHVGPSPLKTFGRLKENYHWLAPLGHKFDDVLTAADLFLSGNLSATTVLHAISRRVPVLVLQNSFSATSADEVYTWIERSDCLFDTEWISKALPLYPFRLWPLGFYNFLSPILVNNPYLSAIKVVEWLNGRHVVDSINDLVYCAATREDALQNQLVYESTVKSLPSPAQALDDLLASNYAHTERTSDRSLQQ